MHNLKHSYSQPHSKSGGHPDHASHSAQQHKAHMAKMTSHPSSGGELPAGKGADNDSDQYEPTSGSPINQHKQLAGMK